MKLRRYLDILFLLLLIPFTSLSQSYPAVTYASPSTLQFSAVSTVANTPGSALLGMFPQLPAPGFYDGLLQDFNFTMTVGVNMGTFTSCTYAANSLAVQCTSTGVPSATFTPGVPYAFTFSNLKANAGPATSLLTMFPFPAYQFFGSVLQNFSANLSFAGINFTCVFGSLDIAGQSASLVCTPAPLPPIRLVNSGVFGGILASTQALGWTVAPNNALVVYQACIAGTTTQYLFANTASTSVMMAQWLQANAQKNPSSVWVMLNAGGTNAFRATYGGTGRCSFIAAEYAGLSSQATESVGVWPTVTEQANVDSLTWTTGTYTTVATNLLLSGASTNLGLASTWKPGPGWTMVASYTGTKTPEIMLQQMVAPAGTYTATGTYALAYQWYDSWIFGIQP